MKRKKICYITTLSSTIRAFFVPQLKYLAKNGYDVTIICNDNIKIMEKFKGTDIHIKREMEKHYVQDAIKNCYFSRRYYKGQVALFCLKHQIPCMLMIITNRDFRTILCSYAKKTLRKVIR